VNLKLRSPLIEVGIVWVSKLWDKKLEGSFKFISLTFLDLNFIGWGETIQWITFEAGLKEAKKK